MLHRTILKLVALLILNTLTLGCSSTQYVEETSAFTVIADGSLIEDISLIESDQYTTSMSKKLELIKSERELKTLFSAYFRPDLPMPTIDFESSIIIGVFSGIQSSGGHGISIESVIEESNFLRVDCD